MAGILGGQDKSCFQWRFFAGLRLWKSKSRKELSSKQFLISKIAPCLTVSLLRKPQKPQLHPRPKLNFKNLFFIGSIPTRLSELSQRKGKFSLL